MRKTNRPSMPYPRGWRAYRVPSIRPSLGAWTDGWMRPQDDNDKTASISTKCERHKDD